MLVLRTSHFKGAIITIRPIVPRHKTLYCLYCSPLNFTSARQFQNHIDFFSTFLMRAVKATKKANKNPLKNKFNCNIKIPSGSSHS